MRAISPIANYGITLIHPTTKRGPDGSGTIVEWTDGELVHAQFQRGGLTEWEQIVALEMFDFQGLPEGVNPLTRVSCFDSEAYVEHMEDDDAKAKLLERIDARLLKLSKLFPAEFTIVEKPAAVLPWPSYDRTPLEDKIEDNGRVTLGILSMLEQSGINPQDVRLYEVENENRTEVVELMESLEAFLAGGTSLAEAIDKLRTGDAPEQQEKISVEV